MIDHMPCDAIPTATTRALEIVLSGDDFDADIGERYGWVNRTLDDDDLDSFVDALVRRLASFDRETLGAVKARSIGWGRRQLEASRENGPDQRLQQWYRPHNGASTRRRRRRR